MYFLKFFLLKMVYGKVFRHKKYPSSFQRLDLARVPSWLARLSFNASFSLKCTNLKCFQNIFELMPIGHLMTPCVSSKCFYRKISHENMLSCKNLKYCMMRECMVHFYFTFHANSISPRAKLFMTTRSPPWLTF